MHTRPLFATAITLVALLVACQGTPQPEATPTSPASGPFRVGLVTDVNGIDDKVWNGSAWTGLQAARDQLGAEIAFLASTDEADYATHIAKLVEEGYDIVVTIGASMADVTRAQAEKHPDVQFAIIAHTYEDPPDNLLGVSFANDLNAFMVGYLAAGMTQSGKVGTFGGMEIPPVVSYMIGFRAGVDHYNGEHGTSVEVLGMGRFINDFGSTEAGRQAAEELIEEGADIIMPVAGQAGRGAAEAAKAHEGTLLIGVDVDWCVVAPTDCSIVLTSAVMPVASGVFEAIQMAQAGDFGGGALGVVGIPPLHEFEDDVPEALKSELESVRQSLADGSIQTGS